MINIKYEISSNELIFTKKGEEFRFKHKHVRVGQIRTHYVEIGSGETILVLPGYPGPWSVYIEMVCELSRKFHVIAMNLPGFPGGSGSLHSKYCRSRYAEYIHEFLESEHISIDYLLGISYGGVVALLFAEMYPQRCKKLILQSPAYNITKLAGQFHNVLSLMRFSLEHKHLGRFMLTTLKNIYLTYGIQMTIKANKLEGIDGEIKELILSDVNKLNEHYLTEVAVEAVQPISADIIRNIKKPVLVITGKDDDAVSPEASRALAEQILPNGEFIEVKDANHWLPVLMPEKFTRMVTEFIAA